MGHLIKFRLGGLFVARAEAETKNVISVSELERLVLIRKLKEEYKVKKLSRIDIALEELFIRKW